MKEITIFIWTLILYNCIQHISCFRNQMPFPGPYPTSQIVNLGKEMENLETLMVRFQNLSTQNNERFGNY